MNGRFLRGKREEIMKLKNKIGLAVMASIGVAQAAQASFIEVAYPRVGEEGDVGSYTELSGEQIRWVVAVVHKGYLHETQEGGQQVRFFQVTAQLGVSRGQDGSANLSFVDFDVLPVSFQGGRYSDRTDETGYYVAGFGQLFLRRDTSIQLDQETTLYAFGLAGDSGRDWGPFFLRSSFNLFGLQRATFWDPESGKTPVTVNGIQLVRLGYYGGFQLEPFRVFRVRVGFGEEADVGQNLSLDVFGRAEVMLAKGLGLVGQLGFRGYIAPIVGGGAQYYDAFNMGVPYLRVGLNGTF